MRLVAVIAAVTVALALAVSVAFGPVVSADPVPGPPYVPGPYVPGPYVPGPYVPGPPYVDHVQWTKWGGKSSLHVYPTDAARVASRQPGTDAQAGEAWTEVLTLSPDADSPSMKAQFLCHWHFAELVEPGKVSWNLEPWRPEVSDDEMIAAGCNPGGPEEPS